MYGQFFPHCPFWERVYGDMYASQKFTSLPFLCKSRQSPLTITTRKQKGKCFAGRCKVFSFFFFLMNLLSDMARVTVRKINFSTHAALLTKKTDNKEGVICVLFLKKNCRCLELPSNSWRAPKIVQSCCKEGQTRENETSNNCRTEFMGSSCGEKVPCGRNFLTEFSP